MRFRCRFGRPWILPRRHRLIVILLICAVISFLICWSYPKQKEINEKELNIPNLLWWNDMMPNYESVRYCGLNVCRFTNKRELFSESKAILMYGSNLKVPDFPLPRQSYQLWALLHEESPRNVPFISSSKVLQHFNITSTFSRHSDFPLTTYHLPDTYLLTSHTYMETMYQRSFKENAVIMFLQFDCDTSSRREDYVRELMRYIEIDSYGNCLHNRDLPESLRHDYLNNLYSPELMRFMSHYKFVLSIENGVCHDYITEKFWRPLITGTIPIYFGSPTIREWAPNNKSVIYIDDFESPQMLAKFLNELSNNDTEFISYLDHKFNQVTPIANQRLHNELIRRPIISDSDRTLFAAFECHVCSAIHEQKPGDIKQANIDHYNCPLPLKHPPMKINEKYISDTDWDSIMRLGQCQAHILNQLFTKNIPFTAETFTNLLQTRLNSGFYEKSLTCD